MRVYRDPRTFSSEGGMNIQQPLGAEVLGAGKMMLITDPPRHVRQRKLVSAGFTPRAMQRLEPEVQRLVVQAVEGVEGRCARTSSAASSTCPSRTGCRGATEGEGSRDDRLERCPRSRGGDGDPGARGRTVPRRPRRRVDQDRIASSVTVWNELFRRRPDLALRLFEPVLLDLRNEELEGSPGYAPLVPCAHANGRLSTLYVSDYFRSVERHPGVRLSAAEREFFDLYDELAGAPGIAHDLDLETGDLLVLCNHTVLHSQSAFEDPDPAAGRLLLRFLASVGGSAIEEEVSC